MEENKAVLAVDRTNDGVVVVRLLVRQILDEIQILQIGQELKDLVDSGANKLILDFSGVDHFSSSALGLLINLKKQIETAHGSLKLCYIRSPILKVFRITRLDEVFSIYKTANEALASYHE